MIAKSLPAWGIALVTSVAGSAAAQGGAACQPDSRPPAAYPRPAPLPPYPAPASYPSAAPGYRPLPSGYRAELRGQELEELRRSDLNGDGWVTLDEAMQHARREFWREDRDRNRALGAREASRAEFARADLDRDGWISSSEYGEAARRSFASFDTNRDGVLGRYELWHPSRASVGWRH